MGSRTSKDLDVIQLTFLNNIPTLKFTHHLIFPTKTAFLIEVVKQLLLGAGRTVFVSSQVGLQPARLKHNYHVAGNVCKTVFIKHKVMFIYHN